MSFPFVMQFFCKHSTPPSSAQRLMPPYILDLVSLNRIVLYCIVLYCIVLYCIVLYCIVLYCIVFHPPMCSGLRMVVGLSVLGKGPLP